MKKKARTDCSDYAFVGFLLLGIACGILFNQVAVGTLIGLALGFISIAILKQKRRS